MKNFVDAFTDAGATGVAVLVAILSVGTLASIGKADPATIFASMTAMGAGLAGFFGGILLADWLANIGKAEGIDGSSLSTLIKNFVDAFSSSGKTGVALLAAIMGVGALVGIVGAAAPGVGAIVIAGGIFGRTGEVVVDSISSPKYVFGVADGKGDFDRTVSKEQLENIFQRLLIADSNID